jgi:hypothetical protein
MKTMMHKTLGKEDNDGLSLSSESNEGNSRSASSERSSTDTTANESDAQSEIAKQETNLVKWSKALVLLVLLAAAAGCGVGKLLLGWTQNKSLPSSSHVLLPIFSYTSLHGQWRGRRFQRGGKSERVKPYSLYKKSNPS